MIKIETDNDLNGRKRKCAPKQIAKGKRQRHSMVTKILETAKNLPQLRSHGMNEWGKLGKRARQVITSNNFAFAELESNAMKRMIYRGEQLMFHTNRTIIARENNSSILEESVIDPTIQRTKNMTATEIKAILVAAYPEKSKSIKRSTWLCNIGRYDSWLLEFFIYLVSSGQPVKWRLKNFFCTFNCGIHMGKWLRDIVAHMRREFNGDFHAKVELNRTWNVECSGIEDD